MRRCAALAVILVTVATPSHAANVYIDFDSGVDLTGYETIRYVDAKKGRAPDDPMHERVVENLEKMIRRTRLRLVDSDPDLYVTYYITTEEQTVADTSYSGYRYAYGPDWSHYRDSSVRRATATTWLRGTLVVDVWDAETGTLVWRGSATQYLKNKQDRKAKDLDQVFDRMYRVWQKVKKKRGLD